MNKALISYLASFFTPSKLENIEKVLSHRTKYLTVVIEDIYHSQNASAVVRSCDCFGIQNVYFLENKNKFQTNPHVSMGASKWVNVKRFASTPMNNASSTCITDLKAQGYRIVATSPHDKQCTADSIPLDKPLAVFFGNEKEGLSDFVMKNADAHLYIPMYGFTESLNISVSAAMIMKTLYERIVKETTNWSLTEDDKNELRLEWFSKSLRNSDYIIADYFKSKTNT